MATVSPLSTLPIEVYYYPRDFIKGKQVDFTTIDTTSFSFKIEVGKKNFSITIYGAIGKVLFGKYATIEESPIHGTVEFQIIQPIIQKSTHPIFEGSPKGRYERHQWYVSFSDDFAKKFI